MTGWAEYRLGDDPARDGLVVLPGEVPEGTPGAVPVRFEADLLGRRVPVAWAVPAAGAAGYWAEGDTPHM